MSICGSSYARHSVIHLQLWNGWSASSNVAHAKPMRHMLCRSRTADESAEGANTNAVACINHRLGSNDLDDIDGVGNSNEDLEIELLY